MKLSISLADIILCSYFGTSTSLACLQVNYHYITHYDPILRPCFI